MYSYTFKYSTNLNKLNEVEMSCDFFMNLPFHVHSIADEIFSFSLLLFSQVMF